MAIKIQLLDRLPELEGIGGLAIPYLGHVEVNLQLLGIRRYNEDLLLLVTLPITYAEKGTSHSSL